MSDTMTTPPPAAAGARPALWTAMPGWGIAADLTPPELRKARQIAVMRTWMAAGLAALILVCGGGYYLAVRQNDAVAADLAVASNRTLELQAVGRSYSDVVSIQNRISEVDRQVAQAMASDVDLVALMDALQSNLPATMTIAQQAITLTPAVAADATVAGPARIGSITMSGTGTTLDDLSDYVDRLQTVPGVVDVVPLSNTLSAEGAGTQYSVSLAVTDVLLSHRFDVDGN